MVEVFADDAKFGLQSYLLWTLEAFIHDIQRRNCLTPLPWKERRNKITYRMQAGTGHITTRET